MPTLIKKISTPRSIHEGSIGSVGAKNNGYGGLQPSDFPDPVNTAVYALDSTTGLGQGGTLSEAGSPTQNGVGFFQRETLYNFDGVSDYVAASDAFFDLSNSDEYSFGGWFKLNWNDTSGSSGYLLAQADGTKTSYAIIWDPANSRALAYFHQNSSSTQFYPNSAFSDGEWVHFAAVRNGAVGELYINGQLTVTGSTGTDTNPTADFTVGARHGAANFIKGSAQDVFVTNDTLTADDINAIYSKRYQNAQLAGGHQLDSDSSPFIDNTDKMFMWPLDADTGGGLTDVSGNGKTLSNLSSNVVFTGVDPFGNEKAGVFTNADNDSVLENADPALDIAAGTDFSMGGFFAATDWATSGSHQAMIGNNVSGATGGVLGLRGSSESRLQLRVSNSTPSAVMPIDFTPGSWHHIAAVYVAAENKVRFYTDGYFVGDRTPENAPNASAGGFCIGGRSPTDTAPAPHDEFGGRASQCFFAQKALTDEDIRKLASARIDFTSNTTNPTDMQFEADYEREDSQIKGKIADGWMVDKRDGKLYVDFGSDTPGDKVNIKLREDK